jgi:hypothetical protein
MQTVLANYTAGVTDLELCLITDPDAVPTAAAGVEKANNPGTYAFQFPDNVTGELPAYLRRGTRPVGGNAIVTMPGANRETWLSGRAAGSAPIVLPAISSVNLEPLPARKLTGYTGGGYTQSFSVLDSNRNPIDLSGKQLQVVLRTIDKTLIGEAVTPTLSGASSNVVTFNAPAAWHETAGRFLYTLWDLADPVLDEPRPWARGEYEVVLTAAPVLP